MKKIVILDTSAIIYRAHFAMAKLVNKNGIHTGAILGLVRQIDMAIKEIEPEYIVAAKDISRKDLIRVKEFKEYKENRSGMPEELVAQLEYIDEILAAYKIKTMSIDGYEADDVIASFAKLCTKNEIEVHIFTGDKDLQQIIKEDNKIFIHILGKDLVVSTKEDVKEYIGVYPDKIPDLFGLMGDKSDGIKGVTGIGPVNGIKLINEYKDLENIYNNLDNIKGKLHENLKNDKELAFISRKLALIKDDLLDDFDLENIKYAKKDDDKLFSIYTDLSLNSLIKDLVANNLKDEKKIEAKTLTKDEMIKYINSKKNITMYMDDNFFNVVGDDKLVYTTKPFDLNDLSEDVYYNLFDAKMYMHKNLKLKDNFFDNLIAAYIIETDLNFEIEDVLEHFLKISIAKYTKTELKKISMEKLQQKSIEITYYLNELQEVLKTKLDKEKNFKNTYETIEKPLIKVLFQMEKTGIKISNDRFLELEKEFNKVIEEYEAKIYDIAGEKFNIDSPMQLSKILFEKLEIKAVKKSKRAFSTDASVLEELSLRGLSIAEYIIIYREYKKLLNTYVLSIPKFIDENNRVHSVFNGTGTVTGRLSSLNPNLQNIPAKNDNGNKIRSCFIAKKGYKLVSFDYSQIELRVLAELSKDKELIRAYKYDEDLHELTAREIFDKKMPIEIITKEMRNLAKIINFSVLYGKTAYGLSKELKISREDAVKYINAYFNKYKSVDKYIEDITNEAVKNGYVETLFGTRRYINGIKSTNSFVFEKAKRMAVNTVIQGTAANIIKLVMIKLSELNYEMLVSVHDELIFEIKEEEIDKNVQEIKEIMENTVKFKNVKLKVNYNIGDNWGELK